MMRRSLYHIKWYFAKTDLNTDKGKAENKKSVVKYAKWYTPEKEAEYPTSFKVDLSGSRMRVPATTASPAAPSVPMREISVFPNLCRCSASLMK